MAKRQTKKAAPKPSGPKAVRRKDATVRKMDSYEDTLEDGGEDQFSAQRDRILLDDTSNQANRVASDDEFDDEEEVFAHKNIPQSDEDEEDYYEDEAPAKPKKKERKPKPAPSTEPKGRFAKPARSASPTSSQEDSDADQDDDEDAAEGSGSDSEDETWGTNANAYYARPSTRRGRDDEEGSGDEDLEERREMEDREARKLQRKGREAMSGGDFGLEDAARLSGAVDELEEHVKKPAAPSEPLPTDAPSLLKHLERTAPETLALAREWGDIALRLPKLGEIVRLKQEEAPDDPSLGVTILHYQTLLTYATTLAFYLHIAALPLDKRPADMSSHPVLHRLVQLKAGLTAIENEDMAGGDEEDDEMDSDDEAFLGAMGMGKDWDEDAQKLWEDERRQNGPGLEDDELKELMADYLAGKGGVDGLEDEDEDEDSEEDSELEQWELDQLEKAKKSAQKTKKTKQTNKAATPASASSSKPAKSIFPTLEEPTPSFSNPTASTSSTKKSRKTAKASPSSAIDDPHSESTTLNLADSSAKAAAKHSLRFHTSKIDSASARRSSARQGRMGGDEDIPYRNKQAARDAALRKNAPKGANDGGDDLDGEEWGEEDRKTARAVKGLDREEMDGEDMEGDDGYYQLVKKRKREEKEDKQDAYDEIRDAQRITDDVNDATGPRSLTRAIMKNRGLTPHRSKAVRNPRVKKRMRFDKAKKQVGSMQAVYKGGQGALKGNYGGEATGISTVVKSRKFV